MAPGAAGDGDAKGPTNATSCRLHQSAGHCEGPAPSATSQRPTQGPSAQCNMPAPNARFSQGKRAIPVSFPAKTLQSMSDCRTRWKTFQSRSPPRADPRDAHKNARRAPARRAFHRLANQRGLPYQPACQRGVAPAAPPPWGRAPAPAPCSVCHWRPAADGGLGEAFGKACAGENNPGF